ncbi:MAG: DNA translocase FtsK [Ignavibacteriales bacterium]|nr:DNA translocase FtsK [Ignavibacteriales bacterium]MCB9210170.1 DNA translocase FtsK [Ignavibacteriales bacterium]MCB9218445.1 DNA translocase FtsK [Ignavibacteriales bacterium]MCB9259549.1 DNA translocase FtsK [Ignavibacteriales bacterium]
MAKQNRNTKSQNTSENFFIISLEKKKKLLGIFLIISALLMLLSIFSYSRYDQANLNYRFTDFFKVFSTDPDFLHRAQYTHNWLGIFGAYLSQFLINSTLGYFSIVIPIICFVWGYTILKNTERKLALNISNFFLIAGIILAAFFGVLRYDQLFVNQYELAGNIGDFFGAALGRLFGVLGSLILLSTGMFIALFIAFDLRFRLLRTYISKLFEKPKETVKINLEEKKNKNLEKIKNLKIPKKKVEKEEEPIEEDEEISEETKIRIIRADEKPKVTKPQVEPEVIVTQSKQISNDEIIPAIDKELEDELPDQWDEKIKFNSPSIDLLQYSDDENVEVSETELKQNAELLREKLKLFDIEIEDISVTPGPVVTLYEIVPSPGVKISRIVSLEHDIALALAARGIRIIAPIPGKSAIGVEIPNEKSQLVSARSVLSYLNKSKAELPIAIGKTIVGEVYITDLSIMPHLLIAGSTGSGKSVGINMLITSLIYAKHPSEVKFVIIDPKKIELSFYGKLNKHYLAVSPDLDEEIITNPQNALLVLKAVEHEMEKRYDKLAKAGVRNIVDYNKKIANPKQRPADTEKIQHHKLPYIIIVIDELADLMMTSGKEVEAPIARLAQLARAVGIHLVVATQRPSVNVITGVIKANFPARIAYQVATKIDSRTILDMNGAEQLLGRGDMLFLPGGIPKPIRMQNAFISTDEVEKITNYIYTQPGYSKRYFLPSMFEKKNSEAGNFLSDLDPMFEDAARVIVRHQQGSVSLLQRRLKLGYSRAARIVDQLEEAGIVGPSEGSKAREVIVENEEQLETILRSL